MDKWELVAAAITSRMEELDLTQTEVAARSGVSHTLISQLMNASRSGYRPRNLKKISESLGWTADSIEQLLNGGMATVQPPARAEPRTANGIALSSEEISASDLTSDQIRLLHALADEFRRKNQEEIK